MANVTVDNVEEVDYSVSTKQLSGGHHVAATELVTATESGTRVDLAKAEDTPHATGDFGFMLMAVRQDTAAALAGTDGDYIPLITDAEGRLHIAPLPAGSEAIGEVAVTTVTPGTSSFNLGKAEDANHASGDTGVFVMGVRQDSLASTVSNDGDYAALKLDGNGALYTSVSSLPAAARTTDSIAAALQTGVIMNGLTAVTPAFNPINTSASGNNTLVAAAGSGNKIRVHQVFLVNSHTSTQTVQFQSGAGGTNLSGDITLAANGGFVLPFSPIGWFETAANTLLNLTLSGATSVDGNYAYTVVT